jgi:hypothetical protein
VATVGVIALAGTAAVLLAPPSLQDEMALRQATAQRLTDQITHAVWNYYYDRGEFPPGDGLGSGHLVRALQEPSREGRPFFSLVPAMLTAVGDIRNPVDPESSIIHYMRTAGRESCGLPAHNTDSFDVWCKDAEGRSNGVNNWCSAVPSR